MNIKKISIILLFIFITYINVDKVFGVPANPNSVEVAQPDGNKITIKIKGDEFYNWYEDIDGYTIIKDTVTQFWSYAEKDAYGDLTPSKNIVGKTSLLIKGIKNVLRDDNKMYKAKQMIDDFNLSLQQQLSQNINLSKSSLESSYNAVGASGTKTNFVLLVQFNDLKFRDKVPFSSSSTDEQIRQTFDDLFNKTNYIVDGAKGSVKDFFKEVSFGKLTYNSVISPIITIDNSYTYYSYNNGAAVSFARVREMIKTALAQLDSSGYNFKDIWPSSSEPEGFTVIHAGGGAESGNESFIWSHQWKLSPTVTYDGIRFSSYHTEPAGRGYNGSSGLIRIGVICHESTHFFGMPDLYDTTYESNGLGNFCLMSGGSWNGGGAGPAHPCVWIKYKLGWAVPQTAVNGVNTISQSAYDENAFYKFTSDMFESREYFLMENRQSSGFDQYLPGSKRGLLIYHIDERKWNNGNNDDKTHYLVDLEEADGTAVWVNDHLAKRNNFGLDSDYYRKDTVTFFNDDSSSSPNSKSYTYQPSGIKISGISASSSLMSFLFGKDIVIVDDLSEVVCYPNPARNGSVTIKKLPAIANKMTIEIFTSTAKLVRSFSAEDTEVLESGIRQLKWDCKNSSGSNVAPGIYLVMIKNSSDKRIIKIAVIR